MYSFHCSLRCHDSLAFDRDHDLTKSSYAITSALINHLSKSVWIAHAACGAVDHFGIVRERLSFSHVVK